MEINTKKIINNYECIESCDENEQYKYEYNGNCYSQCPKGFLYDENNIEMNICKCELDKCLLCPQTALTNNLCTKCNTDYYPKENDPLNFGEYFNCYREPEGYYLDNNLYKKCYKTCKTCNTEGNDINHNCITCYENFSSVIQINNNINCYEISNYYNDSDNENNIPSTMILSKSNKYTQLINIPSTMILTKSDKYIQLTGNKIEPGAYDDIEIIKDILNNKRNQTQKSKEEEIKYYDSILKDIEDAFTSENYDTSNLENGKDEVISSEKLVITFTTSTNQKKNLNNNMTKVDLGECETLLRNFYNISTNETLFMKKIDIVQEGMKTLKVEYDIYCKLFGTNLVKLNLTACGKSQISITIPIVLNEDLDKLNSSSGYYNDICYTTTSEDGTDILLKDRQKEYIEKDKIVCQEDCEFSSYDYNTYNAKCSCKVKESSSSIADMNINKPKLLDNFKDIKNIANFNILVCYKQLFNKENIIDNIGFFIIAVIILFHIICIFIFIIRSFPLMKEKIKNIATGIIEPKIVKENKNESQKTIIFNRIDIYSYNKSKIVRNRRKVNTYDINPMKDSQQNINTKVLIKNEDKVEKTEITPNYIDEEINCFSYNFALQYDKRTYCQYYISLLKTQHNLLCAILNNTDYNSKIIKFDLFAIGFTIEYTINALFYNDDTMHKIYKDKGLFDLDTQIPIIIYSYIISYILNTPLNWLALTNDIIISFKQDNTKYNILIKSRKLVKILFIKFILYFIISTLFLLFFWYYISMFGAIYKNTQIHLLKDILIGFVVSLFFPFEMYLIPGLFRRLALSNSNRRKECIDNFSKFFQSL